MEFFPQEEEKFFNYIKFFGLREPPFSSTPDPDYFFPASSHIKVIEVFKYGFLKKKDL